MYFGSKKFEWVGITDFRTFSKSRLKHEKFDNSDTSILPMDE